MLTFNKFFVQKEENKRKIQKTFFKRIYNIRKYSNKQKSVRKVPEKMDEICILKGNSSIFKNILIDLSYQTLKDNYNCHTKKKM